MLEIGDINTTDCTNLAVSLQDEHDVVSYFKLVATCRNPSMTEIRERQIHQDISKTGERKTELTL